MRELDDVLRVEVRAGWARSSRRRECSMPWSTGRMRQVARAAEPAVVEHRLEVAAARGSSGRSDAHDAVDEVGPGQVQQRPVDRLRRVLEQRLRVVAQQLLDVVERRPVSDCHGRIPPCHVYSRPVNSFSLPRACRASIRRTVPVRERITIESVTRRRGIARRRSAASRRDAGRGHEDVLAPDQVVRAQDALDVVAAVEQLLPLLVVARPEARLDAAADALERGGGDDAFRRAADRL